MSKPYVHAQSSARQFGGIPEDYLAIHNWFDATKAILPDVRHRALRHHAEGIFLCEAIFGVTLTNTDGRKVSVRDVGEQHVLEDFGGRFIPTAQDYLQHLALQDWMDNGKGEAPPSAPRRVLETKPEVKPTVCRPMVFDGLRGFPSFLTDGPKPASTRDRRPNGLID